MILHKIVRCHIYKQKYISLTVGIRHVLVTDQSVFKDYNQMQGKLGRLFFGFHTAIEKASIKLEDLKTFIIYCRPYEEFKDELKNAKSVSDVLDIVRTKLCSLLNYSILVDIANEFKLNDALNVIQVYEFEEENYRKKLSGYQFATELQKENEYLSHHPTTKGTIVLRLRWSSVNPLTVSEFEKIIKEVFSDFYCYIHVLKVELGSIIVTMCVPERVIGALTALAKKRIAYLKDIGVTWLTIGDVIIINDIEDTAEVLVHIINLI